MRLEEFEANLKKRKECVGLQYALNPGASPELIQEAESRLGDLPDQVRLFYAHFNGLCTTKPSFRVFSLEELKKDKHGRIEFCSFGAEHISLSFDTTNRNAANQWTIENFENSYVVTLTMASFWSNKIFGWLDHGRRIWEPEVFP